MREQDQFAAVIPDALLTLLVHSLFSHNGGIGLCNSIRRCSESVQSYDYCQPLNQTCVHPVKWMQILQLRTRRNVKWLMWCLYYVAFYHPSPPVIVWCIIHRLHKLEWHWLMVWLVHLCFFCCYEAKGWCRLIHITLFTMVRAERHSPHFIDLLTTDTQHTQRCIRCTTLWMPIAFRNSVCLQSHGQCLLVREIPSHTIVPPSYFDFHLEPLFWSYK